MNNPQPADPEPSPFADNKKGPNILRAKKLVEKFGHPYFLNKTGDVSKLNEPFWAAYLQSQHEHLLFEPREERFYSYDGKGGLFLIRSVDSLRKELAALILDASRAWEAEHMAELAKFRSEAVLRGVLTHLRGQVEEEDAFETERRIIHCANCVLVREADGFVAERFSPKFRSRSRSPIDYQPKADCPKFKDMILGHLSFEDREILQKLGGQCLLGTNLTQRVLMLDGEAGASKGAFVLILKGIIGTNNCRELRTKQLGEGRFEIGRLLGASLLLGADVPANFLSSEGASRVKSLVGGDLLEPELKTSNEHFYIHGNFNVIVTSNSRLRVRLEGDQSAWGRRLVIVRYDKPFTGKPVPNIHQTLLAEEGPGILNFFIQGAQKLFEDIADKGLVLSAEQKRRVHSLLSESDSLRIYLKSNIYQSVGTHSNLTVAEIVAEYHKSCLVQGWAPLPGRIVERQLPDLMLEFFSTQKANDIERGGAAQRGFRNVRFNAD